MNGELVVRSDWFVDWISARLGTACLVDGEGVIPSPYDVGQVFQQLLVFEAFEPCKPRFGYKMAWRTKETGLVLQFHPARHDMGVNIIATGQTLSSLSWRLLLDCLKSMGAHFARIDLTMDVKHPGFDLKGLYEYAVSGRARTKVRKFSYVESSTGKTFYAGARTAEKFLRVYDKGAQQGLEHDEWFRVELECKGNAANFCADVLGTGSAGLAKSIIGGFFSVPEHENYSAALAGGDEAVCIPSEKKRPNTENWLLVNVAPVLASVVSENPQFLEDFMAAVRDKTTMTI